MAGKFDSTAHAAAFARISEAAKYESEIFEHLDEIIKGAGFKGSHRSQDFLKHIVQQALHGDAADLRERSIGVALFGRPAAYDTADDAIVRVTASDVRKRLLQHYGKEGADSRVRITLPPGSYIPEFSFVTQPTLPSPTIPETVPEPEPPAVRPWRGRWVAGAVAVVVCAVAAGWWASSRGTLANTNRQSLVVAGFQDSPRSAQVVVSDDALVLMQVLVGHRFSLAEYENLSYLNLPEVVEKKELLRFWRSLSTRQITNIGDLQNAHHIAQDLERRGWEINIRLARQMHARSFRTGNFVLLGSSFSNPWADLFVVEDSNFPLFDPHQPGKQEMILNLHPRAGEPPNFEPHLDSSSGKKMTYARVTLLDNTGHSGRVLLVAGQSMSATDMAGEFLLRDESAVAVRKMLGIPSGSPIPNLEMILRVSEQNEIGDSVELVACRTVTRHAN